MKVYTDCTIKPHHAGFGMYQRGELCVGPTTSWAMLSDIEQEGNLTELDAALADPAFQAAGIQDIRGSIYDQPSRIYAKLEEDGQGGKTVAYYGIEESEVPEDFYATPAEGR